MITPRRKHDAIVVPLKKYYVYKHLGKEGVFYVGMGSGGRAFTFRQRPESWQKFHRKNRWTMSVEIVASFWSKTDALALEKKLIKELRPVCNTIRESKSERLKRYINTVLKTNKRI